MDEYKIQGLKDALRKVEYAKDCNKIILQDIEINLINSEMMQMNKRIWLNILRSKLENIVNDFTTMYEDIKADIEKEEQKED